MNWEQKEGYITTGGALNASIKYHSLFDNYQIRVGGLSAHGTAKTEEDAKRMAEEKLAELRKAFILSLIEKRSEDMYEFGNVCTIVKGGNWKIHGMDGRFEGTLEECKDQIVSWLLGK